MQLNNTEITQKLPMIGLINYRILLADFLSMLSERYAYLMWPANEDELL